MQLTNATFIPQSTFDVSGGLLQIDGGLVDTTASVGEIRVGRQSGANASILLKGGLIKCFGLRLGELGGSTGNCVVDGGTLLSTSVLDVGEVLNSPGTLSLLSGAIFATDDVTRVGNLGTGTYNQSGGTASLAFFSVGDNATGTVSVSGGLLTVTPGNALDVLRVGNFGTGQLNISGGTLWSRGEFHVADNFGVQGSVQMTGGLLIATNDLVAIGRYGIGDMTITNATAYFTNTSVGRHDGATGSLTLQNGASLFCVDDLSIGRFANSLGHLVISGGLLSLTNDNIWIGREGVGDMNVTGGIIRARSLFIGMSGDGTNSPQGNAIFLGGTTILSSNLVIGTTLLSTGQVSFNGGTLIITNTSHNNNLQVTAGEFRLGGGLVLTDSLVLTNQEGVFTFNAGELRAENINASNGAPFVVGDGVQPASLKLLGGTYSFPNGLVISSNATVTGCGSISGPVSNAGTLTLCSSNTPVVLHSVKKEGSTVTISFSSVNGATHQLERKSSLDDSNWVPLLPVVVGDGSVMTLQDNDATQPNAFYRVHVQ
jgi:hypothetical protein